MTTTTTSANRRRSRAVYFTMLCALSLALSSCGDDGSSGGNGDDGDAAATDGGGESASDIEAFFADNTVTIVVAHEAGGGYDVEARIVASHLGDRLGGNVVVENDAAGGGLVARNRLARTESRDGTYIGYWSGPGFVTSAVTQEPGVEYTLDDYVGIGLLTGEEFIIYSLGTNDDFQTWEDVVNAGAAAAVVASEGPPRTSYITLEIAREMFGLEGRHIVGFNSPGEVQLAMERGEADVGSGTAGGHIATIEAGETVGLLIFAEERIPELPDVPVVYEYDEAQAFDELLRAHINPSAITRGFYVSSQVDQARLDYLTTAMNEVLESDELREAIEQAGRRWNPLTGADHDALLQDLAAGVPDEYLEYLDPD